MKNAKKCLVAVATAILCWLLLSFLFFPLKLSAPYNIYFYENVSHMVPLKSVITLIFTLLAVFLYEQKLLKRKK